jgi:hypothetical protein
VEKGDYLSQILLDQKFAEPFSWRNFLEEKHKALDVFYN